VSLTHVPRSRRPLAFIDTETTGLDSSVHEVIEFAVVRERGGHVEEWSTKIKPERLDQADLEAFKFNRYGDHPDEWVGAPPLHVVAPAILDMIDGCIIVGHNVRYDVEMLRCNLERTNVAVRTFPKHLICTCTLAHEHLVPCGLEILALDRCCDFVGIDIKGRHTALGDARASRELYHALNRATRLDRFRWRLRAFQRQFRK
jgi:DNA polymerase-3 subunit epsilon